MGRDDDSRIDSRHEALREQLNDFVDEKLDQQARRQIVEHLRDCSECRQEVADLRAVLTAGAELPTDVEPRRDLWPGIAERIDAASSVLPDES